jgi:putative ABC transport system permease protein
MRYVDELEYYDPNTGEVSRDGVSEDIPWALRARKYHDVDYQVAALVTIPLALNYRYYVNYEFVLNDQTFVQDTGTDSVMYYAFDTTDETNRDMETFLRDYTENIQPGYDYESKETYAAEFESIRGMFTILGGVLCFIISLIGVLNFLNAILTGILTRRREFAVLQSIGMTGRQLKSMLIWEGIYYTLGSVLVSLLLCLVTAPLLSSALGNIFWFFTYRFTIAPVLLVTPVFALLGVLLPLVSYHFVAKRSIVERLREAEN